MDIAFECQECGARSVLDAESLQDTHRPGCLRCGGRVRQVVVEAGGAAAAAPPRPTPPPEVDDLRPEAPFPVGREPTDGEGFLWRGHARAAAGDVTGALADAARAVDLDPFLAPAWLLRGALRLRQGDRIGAANDLDHFVRLAPEHPQAERTRQKLTELRRGA
jgi:hypothetical protein